MKEDNLRCEDKVKAQQMMWHFSSHPRVLQLNKNYLFLRGHAEIAHLQAKSRWLCHVISAVVIPHRHTVLVRLHVF